MWSTLVLLMGRVISTKIWEVLVGLREDSLAEGRINARLHNNVDLTEKTLGYVNWQLVDYSNMF